MKKALLPVLMVLLFSCGSQTSKYEQAIADAVQTRNGVKHDLNFKIESISEEGFITVADSMKILSEVFETEKIHDMEYAEGVLNTINMLANLEKNTGDISSETAAKIVKQEGLIEELRHSEFTTPERYANMKSTDNLSVVIRCAYTIDIPGRTGDATVRETFDFYLSPDGRTVYDKVKAK